MNRSIGIILNFVLKERELLKTMRNINTYIKFQQTKNSKIINIVKVKIRNYTIFYKSRIQITNQKLIFFYLIIYVLIIKKIQRQDKNSKLNQKFKSESSMLKIVSKGNFETIQEFSIIEQKKLGSGSFGTVKLAIHNRTNRMYALKIISLADLPTQSQIKLVQRQIKLHSEVDHPHIIKIWDTFNDSQNIYMVMEYAENGNLFYYQNTKNVFSQPQAFKFFTQTLSAILYLHNNDIIHRDLKPQNLLLDQYLNIKICDFGWCAQNIGVKRTTFCGTYEYMAPQMIFRTQYDYRVDIWALGILLYQLLHGIAPFKGKSIQEVQQSMLKGSYQINPKLSSSVKNLISQILQFKVQLRLSLQQISNHPWMKQMQQSIRQYIKQQKVQSPQQIQPKLSKMPISMLKLRAIKKISTDSTKKGFHRKNNSMNLQQESRNININLSINNFSILNKKNKNKHIYHSQDKNCQKQIEEFENFKEALNTKFNGLGMKLKKNSSTKNQARCKTLVDQESIAKIEKSDFKTKFFGKKLSKDNLFDMNPSQSSIKRKDSRGDINFLKKNLKYRKSQQKIDKPVRFNTEAYQKEDQSYLIKLKKNTKKSKLLTSSKNIKNSMVKMQ